MLSSVRLCSVFNMILSADTLSHLALNIFNNTVTHLPSNICYEVFNWPLKLYYILWVIVVYVVFAVSSQKDVKWTEARRTWRPLKSDFLGNKVSIKQLIEVPNCRSCRVKCWLSNRRSWRRCKNPSNVLLTLWFRSWLTVLETLLS